MPVSSGPQLNLVRTIGFVVASLVAGIGLLFLLVQLAGSGDVQFKLGDDVFEVGDAERFAERIDDDGGIPILFSSLSQSRPIYIQHTGTDPLEGWTAFDARSPSDPDACTNGLLFDQERDLFFDSCDEASTFPSDGEGLLQYTIFVNEDGVLIVDLNQDETEPADSAS